MCWCTKCTVERMLQSEDSEDHYSRKPARDQAKRNQGGARACPYGEEGKTNKYAYEAIIKSHTGQEVARIVYRPDKPLSCGARVWIETYNDVELVTELPDDV
jgi:hypothetical protein